MSRAHWLAYGSTLTVLGCLGSRSTTSDTDVDAATQGEETTPPLDDAARVTPLDDAAWKAEAGGQDTRPLPCGPEVDASLQCNRLTHYCFNETRGGGGYSCVSDDAGPLATDGGAACSCLTSDLGPYGCLFNFSIPTSSCYAAECTRDDAGGVTVSCHTCYGAPPARLERLAHVAARIGKKRRRSGFQKSRA
jgi:hypothetical protein